MDRLPVVAVHDLRTCFVTLDFGFTQVGEHHVFDIVQFTCISARSISQTLQTPEVVRPTAPLRPILMTVKPSGTSLVTAPMQLPRTRRRLMVSGSSTSSSLIRLATSTPWLTSLIKSGDTCSRYPTSMRQGLTSLSPGFFRPFLFYSLSSVVSTSEF